MKKLVVISVLAILLLTVVVYFILNFATFNTVVSTS